MTNKSEQINKFPEFHFSTLVFWLKFTGIDVLSKDESFRYRLRSALYMVLAVTCTIIAYTEFKYHSDLNMITLIAIYVGYYTLTLVKVLIIYRCRKEVGSIMISFHMGFLKLDKRRGDDFEQNCAEKLKRNLRFHMSWYGSSIGMSIVSGLIASLKSRLTESQENWTLPFAPMTIMRIHQSPNFEIMYAFHAMIPSLICTWQYLTDCIVISLTAQIIVRIKILEHYTKNHKSLNIRDHSRNREKLINNTLDYVVNYHLGILETVDKVEYICSYMILCVFLSSLVMICAVMYNAAAVPLTSPEFARYLFYFIMGVGEPFVYCWWGNEMTISNEALAVGISQAYNPDDPVSDTKKLKLMLVKAQKPLYFTSGKFLPLSVETFKGILKASFSYFTVLRQVNSQ